MAKFIKHIGRQGDRKVAVVFREVPGEPHMALVIYTQLLGQNLHDPMMSCIESDIGQQSDTLADALNRTYSKDGRSILQVVHSEGLLKKVKTEQVVMTPQPNVEVKLSELNDLLNEMQKGEEAVKRMAELDRSSGLQDPVDVARRMRESKNQQLSPNQPQSTSSTTYSPTDMSDSAIAHRLREQSNKMELEAKGLLAESQRLKKQADEVEGVVAEPVQDTVATTTVKATRTKKTVELTPVVESTVPTKNKPGRPKKTPESVVVEPISTTTFVKKANNVT